VPKDTRKDFSNEEVAMNVSHATLVTNMPIEAPTQITTGSLTTDTVQPPQGQVMKLTLTGLANVEAQKQERKSPPPLFGEHIREGIAVVKDWMKKP
jgi:hypothetical protein